MFYFILHLIRKRHQRLIILRWICELRNFEVNYLHFFRFFRVESADITNSAGEIPFNPKTEASKSYGKTKVALHEKKIDLWIIIKDKKFRKCQYAKTTLFKKEVCAWGLLAAENIKVCDVTSYVENTPTNAILAHVRDDSTKSFYWDQIVLKP
ncbi:hypothetical protein PTKIN_Ptkin15bG0095200 [Pterospermum kingtungense]